MCVYVYIYTHTHMYTHTYIHICYCIYIHTYVYVYVCIYIYMYVHVYIYIHTHTHIHTHTYTCVYIYIYTYIYQYIYIYIYIYIYMERERERYAHIYTYIYEHMYMCVCVCVRISCICIHVFIAPKECLMHTDSSRTSSRGHASCDRLNKRMSSKTHQLRNLSSMSLSNRIIPPSDISREGESLWSLCCSVMIWKTSRASSSHYIRPLSLHYSELHFYRSTRFGIYTIYHYYTILYICPYSELQFYRSTIFDRLLSTIDSSLSSD